MEAVDGMMLKHIQNVAFQCISKMLLSNGKTSAFLKLQTRVLVQVTFHSRVSIMNVCCCPLPCIQPSIYSSSNKPWPLLGPEVLVLIENEVLDMYVSYILTPLLPH